MTSNPLITKTPFRFPVFEITPSQPTMNNQVFRIKFETTKSMFLHFIDDDVEFSGMFLMSDCGWEMRNPKISVSRLKNGTVYRISMEVTREVWGGFAMATVKEETLAKSYIVMSVDGEGLEDFNDSELTDEVKKKIVNKRNNARKNKANAESKPVPKTFKEKLPSQQMSILCLRENFRLFLIEKANPSVITNTEAMLKEFMFIESKKEVDASKILTNTWSNFVEWFYRWTKA